MPALARRFPQKKAHLWKIPLLRGGFWGPAGPTPRREPSRLAAPGREPPCLRPLPGEGRRRFFCRLPCPAGQRPLLEGSLAGRAAGTLPARTLCREMGGGVFSAVPCLAPPRPAAGNSGAGGGRPSSPGKKARTTPRRSGAWRKSIRRALRKGPSRGIPGPSCFPGAFFKGRFRAFSGAFSGPFPGFPQELPQGLSRGFPQGR